MAKSITTIDSRLKELHNVAFRPVARGGVVGVPTPPSGINDIHNFNYLIQERPFASHQASEEALSWHENLKTFLQHVLDMYSIRIPLASIPGFACMPLHVRTHDLQL